MTPFQWALRLAAGAMLGAAALHTVLGLSAERLLEPALADVAAGYASLDSQNRFYGTMFGTTGLALWICAGDPQRHDSIVRCVLWGFLAAGLARLGAVPRYGWPSAPVIALLVVELLLPPVLIAWHAAIRRRAPDS